MADHGEPHAPEALNVGRLAAAAMVVGSGLLAVIVTVWALARFWELSQSSQPTLAEFSAAAALLLGAWGLALLLWGAAEILRRLEEVLETLRVGAGAKLRADSSLPVAQSQWTDAKPDQQARLLKELVHLMREVRDIGLLSESERAARLRHEAEELVGQLETDVPRLLREHNLREAEQRVQRARQRFPSLPNWEALTDRIELARAKFEEHDLGVATREVDELVALGAWDRAVEVVRNLRQRHPASVSVAELGRRVAVERDGATAEERARLMSQAQDATDRREWSEALRLVETLLARFPDSPEIHDLRLQVPTLKANVQVQARQEMETAIRDLIREQHFADALRVANELIERYPNSPQANVLRDRLPRLEQKAAGEKPG